MAAPDWSLAQLATRGSEKATFSHTQVTAQPPCQLALDPRGELEPLFYQVIRERDMHKSPDEGSSKGKAAPATHQMPSENAPALPPKQIRLPGSCRFCKRLKMKCSFPEDENTCARCKNAGRVCVVETRRVVSSISKREQLLAQLRESEATIARLMRNQGPAVIHASLRGVDNAASTDITNEITLESDHPVACGGFSDIYKGRMKNRGIVAIKLVRVNATDKVKKCYERETRFWKTLDHEHVLKFLGTCTIGLRLGIVTPWMANGSASEVVANNGGVDRLKILHQSGSALQYLHSRGIAHGDFKGANILINDSGDALLSDFGLARMLEKIAEFGPTPTSLQNAGSVRYMAPELFVPEDAGDGFARPDYAKADVFSFGRTILELMTGRRPFSEISNDHAVPFQVMQGKHPLRPPGFEDTLWAICLSCWVRNPADRPLMQDVLHLLPPAKPNHGPTALTEVSAQTLPSGAASLQTNMDRLHWHSSSSMLPSESFRRSAAPSPETQLHSLMLHVPNGYQRPPVRGDIDTAVSIIQPDNDTAAQFSMDDKPEDLLGAMYDIPTPAFWGNDPLSVFSWDSPAAMSLTMRPPINYPLIIDSTRCTLDGLTDV